MNGWWRLAPDEHRFAGELRHAAVGEKISRTRYMPALGKVIGY